MGRKKRKVADEDGPAAMAGNGNGEKVNEPATKAIKTEPSPVTTTDQSVVTNTTKQPASSGYAMTSHAGVIVEADIYVSDGSEDEDDDVDVVLAHSRTGLMRRGLLPSATAPMHHRQWVREDALKEETTEEELAQLDPVQRAARLQAEKLRQEQQEKQEALLQESQQNAGRDPALFSKRTAFDIRFDQMEDKPWTRATDLSDFFNYGLSEEDWLEYSEQQMTIRQELIDAARAKRAPDPNIVPVTPKMPQSQQPRVAVSNGDKSDASGAVGGDESAVGDMEDSHQPLAPLGPSLPTKLPTVAATATSSGDNVATPESIPEGIGGAWGAGAAPGSHLAKLIEEQERAQQQGESNAAPPPPPPPPSQSSYYGNSSNNYDQPMDDASSQAGSSTYGGSNYGGRDDYRARRGGRGRGRGRGRGYYGSGGYNGGGDDYYGRKRSRDDWRR